MYSYLLVAFFDENWFSVAFHKLQEPVAQNVKH